MISPGIGSQSPADLFSAVFEKAGGPLELNELVAIAAEIWNIKDQPLEHYDEAMNTAGNLSAPQIGVDVAVGERIYLESRHNPNFNATTGVLSNDIVWKFFAAHPKP